MGLVPTDLPQRLRNAGLTVNVEPGWESRGGSADHDAVVFHWTASSRNESPQSCKDYVFYRAQYAPDYNVLVDRTGVVWLGARLKANSSGDISGVALNEVLGGHAQWASAASRGLPDTTSANSRLWAISAQNDGVGEPWSTALIDGMATCAAVCLEALGLPNAGYLCHHAGLTRRKVDLLQSSSPGVPTNWQQRVNDIMRGGSAPQPQEDEMWVIDAVCPPGQSREKRGTAQVGTPYGFKTARVDLYADCDPSVGVSCYAAVNLEGKNHGLWSNGQTWELWIPGRRLIAATLPSSARGVLVQHFGGEQVPLLVTVSGT